MRCHPNKSCTSTTMRVRSFFGCRAEVVNLVSHAPHTPASNAQHATIQQCVCVCVSVRLRHCHKTEVRTYALCMRSQYIPFLFWLDSVYGTSRLRNHAFPWGMVKTATSKRRQTKTATGPK